MEGKKRAALLRPSSSRIRAVDVWCSHLYWRAMARNTLPLSARHLHPGIGKALMNVERLTGRVGALCLEIACRDGRIAKCYHLHIVVSDAVIFGCFRGCE